MSPKNLRYTAQQCPRNWITLYIHRSPFISPLCSRCCRNPPNSTSTTTSLELFLRFLTFAAFSYTFSCIKHTHSQSASSSSIVNLHKNAKSVTWHSHHASFSITSAFKFNLKTGIEWVKNVYAVLVYLQSVERNTFSSCSFSTPTTTTTSKPFCPP